jgi:predicted site-specific integrase-resolvase
MAEVLTIEEADERLKLKPQTVRDWLNAGRLRREARACVAGR